MITKVLYNINILPFQFNNITGQAYYRLGLEVKGFPDCQAGQFVMLRVSGQLDPLLRRPFGIYKNWVKGQGSRVKGQGSRVKGIEILYKVVGKGTAIMSGLKKGDDMDVLGPLGNSFPLAEEYKNIIMVAGGIGIAPFYLLGARVKGQGARVKLLFGGRNKNDLPALEDFKKLGIDLGISTDDGSIGKKGFVTELLKEELSKNRGKGQGSWVMGKTAIYACGPKPMLKAVAEIADKKNIPCYVSLDNVMACGMGVCLGCAVKTKGQGSGVRGQGKDNLAPCPLPLAPVYKMVCKDGPIFNAREIDWEKI